MADNAPLTEERFLEIVKGLATKEDLKHLATKEDLAEIRSTMATKEDLKESAGTITAHIGEQIADLVTAINEDHRDLKTRVLKLESQISTSN